MSVSTEEKRQKGGFAETLRVIVQALIIAVVIRTFLFQAFNIPSGSMEGTLLVGDYCSSRILGAVAEVWEDSWNSSFAYPAATVQTVASNGLTCGRRSAGGSTT